MSRVTIVGPGRVGTLLAVGLARAGHRVIAVAGGSTRARQGVTGLVAGVRSVEHPVDAVGAADLVVLAVPDDALDEVVTGLARVAAVGDAHRVVHVAGSRGLGALRRIAMTGARVAACHPAMTVRTGATDPDLLIGTAWAVSAGPHDRRWAHELVTDLGGDPHDLPDDRRALYHAGLAVASNAVGAAVATARQLLLAARVEAPEAFLDPLIAASVRNVLAEGAEALTGPVVRGDVGTIAAHLAALDRDLPELQDAYRSLARATLASVRASLDPDVAARLVDLLAAPETGDPAAADVGGSSAQTPGWPGSAPQQPPMPSPGSELPLHPDP